MTMFLKNLKLLVCFSSVLVYASAALSTEKISLFRLWYDGDITREELGSCSQIVSSFTPDSTL
uniref:EF-hand domain-containing protein n=1 Tax=Brassica oleracea TaxID=3712 RepID=A0A3P6E0W8_BRAOL|nr:unnamed protein product [Brassica oleracea]